MVTIDIIGTPLKVLKGERVPTFKELRLEARLTAFKLAVEAEVSPSTISRMEYGSHPVTKHIAKQVLGVLSTHLKREITIEGVSGLWVKGVTSKPEHQKSS